MHPNKVHQLDELIEAHLRITGAVTPKPNPRFDPGKYDPAKEGVPAQKFQRRGNSQRR